MSGPQKSPRCHDDDSLPALAPAPLPPAQWLLPDPEVSLTPERGAGGGILRRRRRGKGAPRRQVRFQLGSGSDDGGDSSDVRVEAEDAGSDPGSPPITLMMGRKDLPPTNALAAPTPNSSLALGEQVRAVRAQEFDAQRAAEELLQRSFRTRCALESRAAEGMNIPRDQQLFQGLVSLQVPEDDVLSSALQEKMALVRPRPEFRRDPDPAGPDPLMFYTPEELFTETPFLGVDGLPALKLQPRPRPPDATFLLYRKLRQWEA